MLDDVELVPPFAQEVADGRGVDRDVHRCERQAEDVADEEVRRERAARGFAVEQQAKPERQDDAKDALDVDRVDGRPMDRVDGGKRARQEPAATEREDHARRGVRPCIRIRERAVDDGEGDQQAADAGQDLLGHPAPRVAVIGAEEVGLHLVWSEEYGRSAVAQDVEEPDQDARQDHRAWDRSARLARLLAHRRGGLEPHEREDAEHHALQGRDDVAVSRNEDRRICRLLGVGDQQDRDDEEDPDLDQAQDHPDAGRELDAVVREGPDEETATDGEDQPQPVGAEPGQLGDERRTEEAEGGVESRRNDRAGEGERPGDEPAEERAKPPTDPCVHATS